MKISRMKTTGAVAAATVLLLTGCNSESKKAVESATNSATGAVGSATSAAASGASDASSAAVSQGASSKEFTMPNEVGKKLQAAQDDLQDASGNPAYISYSDDATGKNRHQLVDTNWQVCSQTPAAGEKVTDGMEVRFKTVKVDETCP